MTTALTVAIAIVVAASSARRASVMTRRLRARRPLSGHEGAAGTSPLRQVRLAAVAVASAIASSPFARKVMAARSRRTYDRELSMALEVAARHVRGGSVTTRAIRDAGAVCKGAAGADLTAVADRAGVTGLQDALDQWVARHPTDSVRLAAAVLSVAFTTGGASASALEAVAGAITDRAAVADEARSLTAQARLSAWVLGVAPAAFALVVSSIDPGAAAFLVTTPAGVSLLAIALGLDVVGAWWMHRLVAGVSAS